MYYIHTIKRILYLIRSLAVWEGKWESGWEEKGRDTITGGWVWAKPKDQLFSSLLKGINITHNKVFFQKWKKNKYCLKCSWKAKHRNTVGWQAEAITQWQSARLAWVKPSILSPPISKQNETKRQAGVSPPVCVDEAVTPHRVLIWMDTRPWLLSHPLHAPHTCDSGGSRAWSMLKCARRVGPVTQCVL